MIVILVLFLCSVIVPVATCPAKCTCGSQDIACSDLTTFPENVSEQITFFQFRDCKFSGLTQSPLPYVNATTLLILYSHLSKISESLLSRLVKLEVLDISGNVLSTGLEADAFSSLTRLTSLQLKDNVLPTLPGGFFRSLPSLQNVVLDDNKKFFFAQDLFDGAPASLTSVSCAGCGINDLSIPLSSLTKLRNLTQLVLNQNNFTALSANVFAPFPSLVELELDRCSISDVASNTFHGLSLLHKLHLGNNQLRSLPTSVFQLTSLRVLHLQNNELNTMLQETVQWKSLTSFRLEGNMWMCDCSIQWMSELTSDQLELTTGHKNATCWLPTEVQGTNLQQTVKSLNCQELDSHSTAVALGIAIPIIIVCLTFIAYYVYVYVRDRRKRAESNRVKYSTVYQDTVESWSRPRPKPLSDA